MSSYWAGLSPREKLLFVLTGVAAVGGIALLISTQAVRRIDDLNARIDGLEQELINLTEQDRKTASVEKAFRDVATEHSSRWTEQEIHDRLREEIYRLALANPPPEGEKPAGEIAHSDYMVQIPTLREGVLHDSGEGYREYRISFRLSPAPPANLLTFLSRIQASRQSLRVDGLELSRDPAGTDVNASLEIVRTVVDSGPEGASAPPELVSLVTNGGFEHGVGEPWLTPGCKAESSGLFATEGEACLAVSAEGEIGQVFQQVTLQCGEFYRLEVDITARGDAKLSVVYPKDGAAFHGGQDVVPDGTTNRIQVLFSPPGAAGESRAVLVPHLTLPAGGAQVFVDNVRLTQVKGE